jgi:hypothetical protein
MCVCACACMRAFEATEATAAAGEEIARASATVPTVGPFLSLRLLGPYVYSNADSTEEVL